jgi:serine/threonine protein kinase
MERTGVATLLPVGSLSYAAPEIYDCTIAPKETVDILEFGLIFSELVIGQKAVPLSLSAASAMKRVISGQRPVIPQTVDSQVSGLISQCWSSRPEDRPTASEVIEKLTAFGFENFPDVDRREITAVIHHIQNR